MKTIITANALLAALVLGVTSGQSMAQEAASNNPPQRPVVDVANAATQAFGVAGAAHTTTAGTSWSPLQGVVLNAGVSESAAMPCSSPANDDCDWVSVQQTTHQGFELGASWRPLDSLSVSVDYRDAAAGRYPVFLSDDGLSVFVDSQDLSLSCELDTEAWGNLELGLQVSRWGNGLPAVAAEDPYTSAALGVGWRWRSFRGGLTGRSTQMTGTEQGNAWNTVDLDFAWRTPWNASLSVGARNLLNEPAPSAAAIEDPGMDDFLGRVPYVRYKQDL